MFLFTPKPISAKESSPEKPSLPQFSWLLVDIYPFILLLAFYIILPTSLGVLGTIGMLYNTLFLLNVENNLAV